MPSRLRIDAKFRPPQLCSKGIALLMPNFYLLADVGDLFSLHTNSLDQNRRLHLLNLFRCANSKRIDRRLLSDHGHLAKPPAIVEAAILSEKFLVVIFGIAPDDISDNGFECGELSIQCSSDQTRGPSIRALPSGLPSLFLHPRLCSLLRFRICDMYCPFVSSAFDIKNEK